MQKAFKVAPVYGTISGRSSSSCRLTLILEKFGLPQLGLRLRGSVPVLILTPTLATLAPTRPKYARSQLQLRLRTLIGSIEAWSVSTCLFGAKLWHIW